MRAVVVYASQTGFTKRYAEWIAEELECEAVAVEQAGHVDAGAFDVVVFGGWLHAGGLVGKKWLARAHARYPQVRFVAFAVGATPPEWVDMVDEAMAREFPAPEFDAVERFYLRGGFAFERLSVPNKLAMKLFFKMQEKAAAEDPRAAEMLAGMRDGFDATDRAAIEPLVAHVQAIADGGAGGQGA